MKNPVLRILALTLALVTILMALPITASAASSSSRCKHRRTKTSTYDTVYVESTYEKHIRIKYRKEVCKSCDKVLERWTEEKEQKHDFDDGVCEDCGYERTIADLLEQDNVIVWKNGSKTVYVAGEKTKWDYAPKNINGTTMVPVTIAAEVLGGEFLYWDPDTNSAYIELDDEEVEYQKNNKKYWVNGKRKTANEKAQIVDGKLYVELKTLTKRTGQDVDYKDGYVFISDDGVSSKEEKQIIDYLYNGKSEEDTMLKDIKAGKVYATSSDGKHIYKRTYDTSKFCKYTDVYMCTIFNIELPKNAVLIQEGNYFYINGEKALADVETLQTVDKRISELNRIIDGANNAYDNGVITKTRRNRIRNNAEDSIEEYEDVAKGKKTLSKVSEVNATYKAKVGNKNNTVEKIQQKLYDLGYTSQLVTGYYGDITFNNVAYFQIVNGLTVTGWVDSTTCNKLFSSSAIELEDESEGIEVKSLLEVSDIDTLKPEVIEQIQYFDELYLYSVVAEEQQIINSFEATYMKEFCEANVLQLRKENKTIKTQGTSLEDFLVEVLFVEVVLGFFDLDLLVSYSYAATLDEAIIPKLTSNANVKIIEKYIAQNLKCKYTVYELYDVKTKEVKYVGRTRQSLDARLKQHHYVDPAKKNLNIRSAVYEGVDTVDLTYSQARGLEQLVFQKRIDDGAELLNKIKPMNVDKIAKSSKLQKYLDDALEFIKKAVW